MFQLCHEINYSAGSGILVAIYFLHPISPSSSKETKTDHEILREALANIQLSVGECLLSFLHVTRTLELWVELLNLIMLLKTGR